MEVEKRKLIKFSNYSLCVTLPKWVVRNLKWKKGDLVDIQIDDKNGKIIISNNKKSILKKNSSDKNTQIKKTDNLRW